MSSNENDFLWLEDLHSPRSQEWVKAQNQKTVAALQKRPHFDKFYERAMQFHASEGQLPLRAVHQGFVYHVQVTPQNPLGVWVRTPIENLSLAQIPWEVLLDLDQLSKLENKQWYFHGVEFAPSGNHCLLALSDRGLDKHQVREFDLANKNFVPDGFALPESKCFFMWIDAESVLVGGFSEATRNHLGYTRSLFLWKRGQALAEASLVIEGDFNGFSVYAGAYRENRCGIRVCLNWEDSVFYLYSKDQPLQLLHLPAPLWDMGIWGDRVVFQLSRDDGPYKAGSVLETSLQAALTGSHQGVYQVIAQDHEDVFVESFGPLKESFGITFTRNVSHEMRLYQPQEGGWKEQTLQLPAFTSVRWLYEDRASGQKFLTLENFLTPVGLYRVQSDGKLQLIRQAPEIYSRDFVVDQNWTTSADGMRVPYYIIHKPGLKKDSSHPTLLYAYGGFASGNIPFYTAATGRLWLEEGGIFVVANIRGGNEFGAQWHRSAILENKQRSYDDLIAVSEDLIQRGYTQPKHLGIRGGSNGGLLVGAVMAQRPELFNAVLCEVPLLDMIRYVELPPGASWMAEYGDPRDPKMREVILRYSPYQNVHAGKKYPEVLFTTSITDDRVHPSHARRMAAKMMSQGHDVFFYEESSGGHGQGDLKTKSFVDALRFSYLWYKLGHE